MATVALRIVGTALGGVFGPVGAAIGGALGSLAGAAIDQAVISSTRKIEGARMTGARPMSADSGHAVARAYGYCRIAGTVIWATQLTETASTSRTGAKGGPKRTDYSYSCSFAVAVCEGPVNMIKRIWADGKELDLRDVVYRSYLGDENQQVDPLIQAIQGNGNAPAYRGIAYVVFEDFPLERFGNRVPSISFELVNAVGVLEDKITAMCLIPGSTEYGLSPTTISRKTLKSGTLELNRHILHGDTDYTASMDELQALCPNLKHISLVVSWFGDDLRAGQCRIRPGVTERTENGVSEPWHVAGLNRNDPNAHVCSGSTGRSNYGGTPTDESVLAVIADLKQRGLKVTLNPFVLMDILPGNGLPDPWGAAEQAAHPWRGRITCYPAPGRPGSSYDTPGVAFDVSAFVGGDHPSDFGYRRFILHYADLAARVGGVDAFLIGSEFRGLTALRDGTGFPFVDALMSLASEVRAVLGPQTKITYGADWSEYFGVQPPNGGGDIYYNLDPLWAHAAIDAIGIDNYLPLADWRDGDVFELDANPDGAFSATDKWALRRALTSGEGYDWYYASDADREDRLRSPISDGAYGKPWVYRFKDLRSWWSHSHYDRINGQESEEPSAWVPQSKPFWFTELGCPAIDRGANQPNVFADPKSSENAWPYFSHGSRDDAIQRAFLDVHLSAAADDTDYNPLSDNGLLRMIDTERLYIWAWDARPFPGFPLNGNIWGDGENWLRGHWLNGRLGTVPIGEWAQTISASFGLHAGNAQPATAVVTGILVGSQATGRAMIEGLIDAFGLVGMEDFSGHHLNITYVPRDELPRNRIAVTQLIADENDQYLVETLKQSTEMPSRVAINYADNLHGHMLRLAQSKRLGDGDNRVATADLPVVMDEALATYVADTILQRQWTARHTAQFSLPLCESAMQPGDVIVLNDDLTKRWFVDRVDAGIKLDISAINITPTTVVPIQPTLPRRATSPAETGQFSGLPVFEFLDLPMWDGADPEDQFRVAVAGIPTRAHNVLSSIQDSDYALRLRHPGTSIIGSLGKPLAPSPSGRFVQGQTLEIKIPRGELASRTEGQVFAGSNALAVRSKSGQWEIIQFVNVEELADGYWRASTLLRGQAGTEDASAVGADIGASVVVLDQTVTPAGLPANARGLARHWRIGPSGKELTDRYYAHAVETGGLRACLPLSPVHLRVSGSRSTGINIAWIRRSRFDADSWIGNDIPLGEAWEKYQVTITDNAGQHLIDQTVSDSTVSVGPVPAWPATIDITVRQISDTAGPGLPLHQRVTLF